ncbi:MAG TPA: transposase [Burkholderiaceae bacterium]
MARQPRLVVPSQAHHVVQFAVDRQTIFRDTEDHQYFINWLRDAAKLYKVAIHAYVLMLDHVHLAATPSDTEGLARMMQWAGRHYVPYFNRKYQRSGTLWQGRFKAGVIDAEHYLLLVCRYIETNPVRAGLVANAQDYAWSSYRHHIGSKPDPLVTDHMIYWSLGNTPFQREAAYQQMAEQALTSSELQLVGDSAHKGWVLGSDIYKSELEKQINRQVGPGRRGRPRKVVVSEAEKPPESA